MTEPPRKRRRITAATTSLFSKVIPADVDTIILGYLDTAALMRCFYVCKHWNSHLFGAVNSLIVTTGFRYTQVLEKSLNFDQLQSVVIASNWLENKTEELRIGALLSKCPNLTSLDILSVCWGQFSFIATMTQLKRLKYPTQQYSIDLMILPNMTNLEFLSFKYRAYEGGEGYVNDMWQILTRLTKIQDLDFRLGDDSDDYCTLSIAPLQCMTQLTRLSFGHMSGDYTTLIDVELLSSLTNLKDFRVKTITDGIDMILQTLSCSLTHLDRLGANHLDDTLLSSPMAQNVTWLRVRYAQDPIHIFQTSLQALRINECDNFDFVKYCPNVSKLHLSTTGQGDLLRLTSLQKLQCLTLYYESGTKGLPELLSRMPNIMVFTHELGRSDQFSNLVVLQRS